MKKIIAGLLGVVFLGIAGVAVLMVVVSSELPEIITLEDYQPLLVSEVYDRDGQKIGEFFRERRILVPFEEIPEVVTQAFLASEDDEFYNHGGINYVAIFRSVIANIKAGRKVQGGSTITQQVARTLLLTREKTYIRKIKEVILAYRMEANLSKQDILYLYLNQIYLGHGAYGVEMASRIYFRKPLKEITAPEAALLAGLPQAPSRYSPVRNPSSAKARQKYVLSRMATEEFLTEEEAKAAVETPLQIYVSKDYQEMAPFYLETVRQTLIKHLGETEVLDKGLKIKTGLDLQKQLEAQKQVRAGLRSLDKRQGYRGSTKNIETPEEIAEFLLKGRNKLLGEVSDARILQPDGTFPKKGPLNLTGKDENGNELPNVPHYVNLDQIVDGIVTKVDDEWGIVHVRFAESKGLIDFETMKWARKPNPDVKWIYDEIKKPSEALKKGDVIQARVVDKKFYSSEINKKLSELKKKAKKRKKEYVRPDSLPEFKKFALLELEQEPAAEAALVSIDQNTEELIAMVGGYDFDRSQFNRAIQAARQTGSAFKTLVYAAALDKGYTPATPIIDAPLVFEEEDKNAEDQEGQIEKTEDDDGAVATKKWKPTNHSKKFFGDILFRNALIKSLNVPTVKIIEKIGVDYVADYAKRMGIFSPLNMDFTLALGSSSVTLYELTKVFSEFGKMGKRVRPTLIHKVENQSGEVVLEKVTMDDRFEEEIKLLDESFEERREKFLANETTEEKSEENAGRETADDKNIDRKTTLKEPHLFFKNPEQLIRPTTAYVTTSLLQGAVEERGGTGGRARALGRPVAGKTGSTSGYYDGWFVGFSADISTGVWVGFDQERSLGKSEVGGRAALPIWLEYMKFAHEGMPPRNFPVPEGIVFANIDNETGRLASASSDKVVRQAFIEGTEPQENSEGDTSQEERDFYKEDLSE